MKDWWQQAGPAVALTLLNHIQKNHSMASVLSDLNRSQKQQKILDGFLAADVINDTIATVQALGSRLLFGSEAKGTVGVTTTPDSYC